MQNEIFFDGDIIAIGNPKTNDVNWIANGKLYHGKISAYQCDGCDVMMAKIIMPNGDIAIIREFEFGDGELMAIEKIQFKWNPQSQSSVHMESIGNILLADGIIGECKLILYNDGICQYNISIGDLKISALIDFDDDIENKLRGEITKHLYQ